MRITFRSKLLAIVGAAALAFVLLILTGLFISKRVESQLTAIQEHFLPKLELGPRLEGRFDALRRGFQDAVAAQDGEELNGMHALKDAFFKELEAANSAVHPAQAGELRHAMEEYYATAFDVSRRLIKGETGEELVKAMAVMQGQQARTLERLKKATALDRGQLTAAFTTARKAQATATRLRIAIALLCLVVVLALALVLSRGVLHSLSEFASGFERYGKGDFRRPIPVETNDELGDAARQANQMAARIEELLKEQEAQAAVLKKVNGALAITNKELEAFSYSVAHDLRAPLRSMLGFSNALMEDYVDVLPEGAKDSLGRVALAARKMGELIDGLLSLSRLTRKEITRETVNLSALAHDILIDLQRNEPERKITIGIAKNVVVKGDSQLLQAVLVNLLGNAWKFSGKQPSAQIEFGAIEQNGHSTYFVRDNGAGFDMHYADKLFGTFQRLHSNSEFEGTGIGLATVQRIVHRHGGEIWAQSEPQKGATFYFTLG